MNCLASQTFAYTQINLSQDREIRRRKDMWGHQSKLTSQDVGKFHSNYMCKFLFGGLWNFRFAYFRLKRFPQRVSLPLRPPVTA